MITNQDNKSLKSIYLNSFFSIAKSCKIQRFTEELKVDIYSYLEGEGCNQQLCGMDL